MKYLLVGLGNIGPEYELTRHNIGFLILDRLADQYECTKWEQSRHAFKSELTYKSRTIHLIKPTTYMNLSGKAVTYWQQELKIEKENTLVITDDLALDYGVIRMRKKGSAGGHNGLKNIEQLTGGQDYPRLRFGVGDAFVKGHQVDYVLSPFSKTEMDELVLHMDKAVDASLAFCTLGIDRAMNQFNG
ncbi:MAG: aminoacyl-tRNA hydrolase [Cyclobacteriaceae bacterium]